MGSDHDDVVVPEILDDVIAQRVGRNVSGRFRPRCSVRMPLLSLERATRASAPSIYVKALRRSHRNSGQEEAVYAKKHTQKYLHV